METILIVDDDKDLRFNLANLLKDEGYNTISFQDGKNVVREIQRHSPNLILLDHKLPDGESGMDLLDKIKKSNHDLAIIMLTAYGDIKDAVEAIKSGASDYITKPFDNEELIFKIKKALHTQHLTREVVRLKKKLGEDVAIEEIMGTSPQIKEVLKQVEIIAPTKITVILQGESGVGKEVIANMIHQKSPRENGPFIAIDCGVIPETLFESELFGHEKGAFTGANGKKEGRCELANGGTLFLDEITNLSEAAQRKFLRVIEERKIERLGSKNEIDIDVRIIVATNIGLLEAVKAGKFREDLFHRLNEFHINLPPLRERREDIPVLANYFLKEANQEFTKNTQGFSKQAMKAILNFSWPGNVRELRNVVRKGVLLSDSNLVHLWHISLYEGNLPNYTNFYKDMKSEFPLKEITKKMTEQVQRDVIRKVLAKADGNKVRAAKILKIDRMTLYSKIKELQIK